MIKNAKGSAGNFVIHNSIDYLPYLTEASSICHGTYRNIYHLVEVQYRMYCFENTYLHTLPT